MPAQNPSELSSDGHAALIRLGLDQATTPETADFSGITDDPAGLFISLVIHEALIDVNEKGTEAAAATGARCRAAFSEPREPIPYKVDHPFLFLLRDRKTNWIYFMGRVMDPMIKP